MSIQRNQRKRVGRVMRIVMRLIITCSLAMICYGVRAQDSPPVPIQPFALHVRQVEDALEYLGHPLSRDDQKAINDAIGQADETKAVAQIERVLDKYVLCIVDINAESRVKVEAGPAKPELVEGEVRLFLVKVHNDAHMTAPLVAKSRNSGQVYVRSKGDPRPPMELTAHDAAERWADFSLFNKQRMT